MRYTEEQLIHFEEEYIKLVHGLQELMYNTVLAGKESANTKVKEHMLHGVGRRLSILKKCLENIFDSFPPMMEKPLEREILYDVQINIHAYVINLYGIFDNWAWSFVLQSDLLKDVGGKHGVSLFRESTRKYLAKPLYDYLTSELITSWYKKYLKSYRDALAHRIPLYIPPAEFTEEEGRKFNQIENNKLELIKARDWDRLEEVEIEQANIGRPSFVFLHSYNDSSQQLILFHPQLLSDGLAIVEFGNLFLKHWTEVNQ